MKRILYFIFLLSLFSCEEGDPLGPKRSPCNVVVSGGGIWGNAYKGKFGRCFIYDGKKKIDVDKKYCDC
jgi:hypothetical protein